MIENVRDAEPNNKLGVASPDACAASKDAIHYTPDDGDELVSWNPVRQFVRRVWPTMPPGPAVGSQAWEVLDDSDPQKIAALMVAGLRRVLETELAQRDARVIAAKDAAVSLAALFDWGEIAKRVRSRDEFYAANPHLLRGNTSDAMGRAA